MIDSVQCFDGDGQCAGVELMARTAAITVKREVESTLACFLNSDIALEAKARRALERMSENIEMIRGKDLWRRLIKNERRIRQVVNDLGVLAMDTPKGFEATTAVYGLYRVSEVLLPLR